ncbi:hypothetical protein R9X47_22655 [Wukongibacter baidiensis]|uniref:hypothetical protein n=1 Tax=Wukongibacter baidiensis TaxID=1723361 RepID=UPI003D7FCB9F
MKSKMFLMIIVISIILIGVGTYYIAALNNDIITTKTQNDNDDKQPKTNITGNINTELILQLTDEDFVIENNNNFIELGGKYKSLKTNDNITNKRLANESFSYNVYVFENFKLMTNQSGQGNSIIMSINLTSSELQTSRGIKVGDEISLVLKKYGNADEHNVTEIRESYTYYYNESLLTFYTDNNGKVSFIRFESI